jgi:branched-chain amino acid transport system permease protein
VLQPSFQLMEEPFLGVMIGGRLLTYYLIFVVAVILFLLMLRIVNSPFGRVLQAIRENDFRAEAIGYRIVVFRIWSNILGALFATLAGCLMAMALRYNSPDTSLSFQIMIEVLLIVVIGGMGTLYGAVCGTTIFLLAEGYLQELFKIASEATAAIPMLSAMLSPDRWLLWLGILYILSVYFLPMGIVGKLRLRALLKK